MLLYSQWLVQFPIGIWKFWISAISAILEIKDSCSYFSKSVNDTKSHFASVQNACYCTANEFYSSLYKIETFQLAVLALFTKFQLYAVLVLKIRDGYQVTAWPCTTCMLLYKQWLVQLAIWNWNFRISAITFICEI